jgi:hypothetical protein
MFFCQIDEKLMEKNGNEKVLEFSPVFHVNGDYTMTIANTTPLTFVFKGKLPGRVVNVKD